MKLNSSSLSIANVELSSLDHVPLSTGFVDITALGDSASVEYWHFPNIPSLSNHPYIMFRAANSRPSHVPAQAPHNLFPNPSRCSIDLFKELLLKELELLPVPNVSDLASATSIDSLLDQLLNRVRKCAVGAKIGI